MEQMDGQREQILRLAAERFRRLGIRSVSVDDLSRETGISKKTFYKFFANKEALVEEVLKQMRSHAVSVADRFAEGKSAIECIRALMDLHKKTDTIHRNPPFEFDMEKYYPKLYKKHTAEVHLHVRRLLEQHLQQGINEGIYRSDLDVETYSILFSMMQNAIMRNEDNICELNPNRIFRAFFGSFFRSILSEEGKKQVMELWKGRADKH